MPCIPSHSISSRVSMFVSCYKSSCFWRRGRISFFGKYPFGAPVCAAVRLPAVGVRSRLAIFASCLSYSISRLAFREHSSLSVTSKKTQMFAHNTLERGSGLAWRTVDRLRPSNAKKTPRSFFDSFSTVQTEAEPADSQAKDLVSGDEQKTVEMTRLYFALPNSLN